MLKRKFIYANIFDFIDYRKFLEEYFKSRHSIEKKFTKSYICGRIGLPNSRSYFSDIISGLRNISNSKVELLIEALELNKEEAQFFRFLVQYNQTSLVAEKEFYFEQLISLNQTPKKFVSEEEYEYYKDWYNPVIRALLDVVDFKDDYKVISRNMVPSIPASKIRASISLLKKLKFIRQGNDGCWRPTNKNITTGTIAGAEMIKKYQKNCLEQSAQALYNPDQAKQYCYTKTLSVSEKGLKRIQRKIKKFSSEVSSIIHKDEKPSEQVYQINFHVFPHSQKNGSAS